MSRPSAAALLKQRQRPPRNGEKEGGGGGREALICGTWPPIGDRGASASAAASFVTPPGFTDRHGLRLIQTLPTRPHRGASSRRPVSPESHPAGWKLKSSRPHLGQDVIWSSTSEEPSNSAATTWPTGPRAERRTTSLVIGGEVTDGN